MENEFDSALKTANNLLSRQDYSKNALIKKLENSFGEDVALEVTDFLEKKGLVNDNRFAEELINFYYEKNFWAKAVEQKLVARGFSPEFAREKTEEFFKEYDQSETIKNYINNSLDGNEISVKALRGICRYLISHGFDEELTFEITQDLLNQTEDFF